MIDKRMMYSQGQRVAKSLDGSRPGYRGSDMGTVGTRNRAANKSSGNLNTSGADYGGGNQGGGGDNDYKDMTGRQIRDSYRSFKLGVDPASNPIVGPDGPMMPYQKFRTYRPEVPNIPLGPFSILSNLINPKGVQPLQMGANFLASVNRPFFVDKVVKAGKYKNLNPLTVDKMTNEELEAAYKEYNRARLNNEIDAYGNPIVTFGKDQGDYSDSGLPSLANYNMLSNLNNQNNQNASGLFSSRFLQNQPDDIRENIEASMQNYYTV
jgi:hypothetical protein|tara:strand:+ start:694 stop:1491 length:798 start_codon:yes stop_codon:yes gene_type:complete